MNSLLTILVAPAAVGLLFPNIWLVAALLLLKLFDWWSTHYMIKNGGSETMSLPRKLIDMFGLPVGIALDFLIVAVAAWFTYPYWPLIAGVVAWYAYWMAIQVGEVRKTQAKS